MTHATTPFKLNPLHTRDSYKLGHPAQYPDNTEFVYSNLTARSDRLSPIPESLSRHKLVWVGLQATISEYVALWQENFFNKPLEEVLATYAARVPAFSGAPLTEAEAQRVTDLHRLGYLPLHVKALPEGSLVNMGVPLFTFVNTNPEFGWLTNSMETYLSNESWKLPTVATIAKAFQDLLVALAEDTGAPREFVDWQGHCFADRGMSGMMDAAKTCAGHAFSFFGSDSVSSVDWLEHYYGAKGTFVSGSVPATEHAVMCLGGDTDEKETIRRLIQDVYPTGVVSVVSDTWDFWNVVGKTAKELKDIILARQPNDIGLAKVVFRPDSGDPADVLCGTAMRVKAINNTTAKYVADKGFEFFITEDKYYQVFEVDVENQTLPGYNYKEVPYHPSYLGAVEVLWNTFQGTYTDKGFKVLHPRVGLIYGDSITLERAFEILMRLRDKGFASCNVVLGIGSYTYQYITRDSFGMAIKATNGVIAGVSRAIYKDPVTDVNKVKKSAKGLLRVEKEGDDYVLYDQQTPEQEEQGLLQTVYKDGKFFNFQSFADIRARIDAES